VGRWRRHSRRGQAGGSGRPGGGYERAHFHIDAQDPVEAIKLRLEQRGADAKSLAGIIGSRTRVYEVLRGGRPLTLQMIRRLHQHLQIPAELLIRPTRVRTRKAAA
jgi:HTH-type transcriptional regulator/antitoxin HigA